MAGPGLPEALFGRPAGSEMATADSTTRGPLFEGPAAPDVLAAGLNAGCPIAEGPAALEFSRRVAGIRETSDAAFS